MNNLLKQEPQMNKWILVVLCKQCKVAKVQRIDVRIELLIIDWHCARNDHYLSLLEIANKPGKMMKNIAR